MLNVPFLVPNDATSWAARIEAASRAYESAFGIALDTALPMRSVGTPIALDDRPRHLAKLAKSKRRWFSLVNAGRWQGTLGGSHAGAHAQADTVIALMLLREPAALQAWFVATGDALQAWSGVLDVPDAFARLGKLQWEMFGTREPLTDVTPLEARLPKLRYVAYEGLAHPAQPTRLGWLNYWSDATAQRQGLPCAEFPATRTPGGGWLLRLTEEPLDTRRDDHAARLLAGYERFRDFPFAPAR